MSTTTRSPASIVRPDSSWCGLAPFGPDPTIVKSTPMWPSSRIAAAMSAPTSRLGAAHPQPLGHAGVHPVDGRAGQRPAPRPRPADLTMRSRSTTGLGELQRRAGQRPLDAERVLGPGTARRRRPGRAPTRGAPSAVAGQERERVVGLVPGQQLQARGPPAGLASTIGASSRGTTRNGSPAPRHRQRGQPLHGVRVVAGTGSAGPSPGVSTSRSIPASAANSRAACTRSIVTSGPAPAGKSVGSHVRRLASVDRRSPQTFPDRYRPRP